MNSEDVERLYRELAAAPVGVALRLGVEGNTPEAIEERWQRWNALADYEELLRREAQAKGVGHVHGRILGLPEVGRAYGDLDRLEPSTILLWQMEEHLESTGEDLSDETLKRVVEDAIEDARNPDRRSRVPGKRDVAAWWAKERPLYVDPEKSRPTGMDLTEADEAVVLLRKRIVDAMLRGQALAEDPRSRIEAERYVKKQLADANVFVEFAARKYRLAAQEFQKVREREDTPDEARELLEANEEVARNRVAALLAYSAALHLAAQRTTPFMAGIRPTLAERFPGQEREILFTQAGRWADATSVEAVVRMTPKDPKTWFPKEGDMRDDVRRYVDASAERDRLDWKERLAQRHPSPGPSLRGTALAMACYDMANDEQKEVSAEWGKLSAVERAGANDGKAANSESAYEYAKMIGIPAMPALSREEQAMSSADTGLSIQKSLVEKATDPTSMYSVAPPTPAMTPQMTVGLGN